jgi:GNAT superfamily N-acetyltransferase
MVEVKEVRTKRQLRKFVDFPNKLYADCEQYIPSLYADDLADWNPKRNPAFEYCEAKCYLAYRDKKIVGRIAAILNHRANEKWQTKRMRFSQVDFIDDFEVSSALFAAVENYAREKGCTEVHGPLGFCDMDREGMLVEGFEHKSMFITYYNHPYYIDHLTRLGYAKDVDWVERRIEAPDDEKILGMISKTANYVIKRLNLHIADIRRQSQYGKYVMQVFRLLNIAYAPLYSTVELTERQIKRYARKFGLLINPQLTCFVMNEKNEMVAFGIAAPAMEDALKKCRGRLFPLGWYYVLRALHKNDAMDLCLIAVHPKLNGIGVNAIILDHVLKGVREMGIKYAETGPMLETNHKIQAQWKYFKSVQHKRRRCFIKNIEAKPERS